MKKSIRIFHPEKKISGSLLLPGSKSESSRALIINRLSGNKIEIENLSSSEDTQNLRKLLALNTKNLDVKDAGSNMRFLTAYYCVANKNRLLSGSQRMTERPVGKLVDALRNIGFKIFYSGKEGFPPVEIIPSERISLKYEVSIEADESSQFVSALLMIAPVIPDGLVINLKGKIISRPYIDLTLQMMKKCGIKYEWKNKSISITHQNYQPAKINIEPDWTSASYYYSMAVLSDQSNLFLKGYKKDSFQGDSIIAEWMKYFGITTRFTDEGIEIIKTSGPLMNEMTFDFSDHPDLAQTIMVAAAAKNIRLRVIGIESLRIKETDRIKAMQTELKNIGAELIQIDAASYQLIPDFRFQSCKFHTYEDHRMAMSFAPLGVLQEITVIKPLVVGKSYPGFWEHLKEIGFTAG